MPFLDKTFLKRIRHVFLKSIILILLIFTCFLNLCQSKGFKKIKTSNVNKIKTKYESDDRPHGEPPIGIYRKK